MEKRFIDKHANNADIVTSGIEVSQYIGCGKIVFNTSMASKLSMEGEPVILVKNHLFPEDVEAAKLSQGVLLAKRDTGIFAMLMSRTLKKSCILASNIDIDEENSFMIVDNKKYKEGTVVSLDGHTGNVYLGAVPQVHRLGYNDLTRRELKKKSEKIYFKNN